MHDGVLAIAADVLAASGIAHLRFNFRGVGASEGDFDNGRGESDDICAAWDWLKQQAPARLSGWDSMLLIGYSFGAATAWTARTRCSNLQQLLLIAPPTKAMSFAGAADGIATRVIAGDSDSYCDLNALPTGASVQVITSGDHFFSGSASRLADAITQAI
jgi:alpha/beta superfamily hydrolase